MACLNCQSMDLGRDRSYHVDTTSNAYNHYNSMAHSPNIRSPCSEMYTTGSYTTAGWITPASMDYSRSTSGTDTSGLSVESRFNHNMIKCRGDQPTSENNVQMRKIVSESAHDSSRHRHSLTNTPSFENIRMRLKLLEDKNATIRDKCRKLLTENESFKSCLEKEKLRNEELEHNVASLNAELAEERKKVLKESSVQAEREIFPTTETSTSTTDIVTTVECGTQNWSLCQGCQNKLENCMNGVPAATVTRSELDILEKDMQSLRDAVIAREEAWDKAMERERTYRQQILRLTCEAITNRHIQESRDDEIRAIKDTLREREYELKGLQKRESGLNKIVTKLYRYQRDLEGNNQGNGAAFVELSDKEQKMIEECLKQVTMSKGKSKTKSKCNNAVEKNTCVETQRVSPRNNNNNNNNKSTGYGKD
ncbi:hypothetical protein KPH14_002088 [Odynerus spinipes]|uniref:Uncharacterized protein n=1 Tax=Odynerus spinipes TaxID=1348599 RepID=A0AAD9RKR7_9HYME|nr:hypothetical protein KPH14_002088 [Odynerus spinipes]